MSRSSRSSTGAARKREVEDKAERAQKSARLHAEATQADPEADPEHLAALEEAFFTRAHEATAVASVENAQGGSP